MENIISPGDYILVYRDSKRNWLVRMQEDKKFFTSEGHIELNDVIGQPKGILLHTHTGVPLFFLEPMPIDFALHAPRKTNILYPKDIGLILVNAGIQPGLRVVESGAGSGAVSTILASTIQPNGHLYTYEVRSDFLELTRRNLQKSGLEEYVTLREQDLGAGIHETDIDVVMLDLGNPWDYVEITWKALKPGGRFVSYSPNIEQVIKTVNALNDNPFCNTHTFECFLRNYRVETNKTRPLTQMIGHTGYITISHKYIKK